MLSSIGERGISPRFSQEYLVLGYALKSPSLKNYLVKYYFISHEQTLLVVVAIYSKSVPLLLLN